MIERLSAPSPAPRRWTWTVSLASLLVAALAVGVLLGRPATAHAAAPEVGFPAEVGSLVTPFAHRVAETLSTASDATAVMTVVATPPPPTQSCPVPGSEFINSWGFSRSGGRRHKGVDMMAPHGTPVIAPVSGTVRSSNSRLGGIGFYLDDADGNTYFGAHMQSLTRTGWVEAGTQIGTVGSSGNASASGPHLHFEVMLAGVGSVNPYPYAAGWCAS